MLVQHHTKYKEIHGYDEIIIMTVSDHKKLHQRLRQEGICTIPPAKLLAISHAAHMRTSKGKETQRKNDQRLNIPRHHKSNRIQFQENVGKNVRLQETISVHPNTGTMNYTSLFRGNHKKKLKIIDI